MAFLDDTFAWSGSFDLLPSALLLTILAFILDFELNIDSDGGVGVFYERFMLHEMINNRNIPQRVFRATSFPNRSCSAVGFE